METFPLHRGVQSWPGDASFAEVEKSLTRAGRVEELARLYQARASELSDPREAARLLCRAADLVRDRTKNIAKAEELYRRALLMVPDMPEPLRALKSICEQKMDYASLAEVLERLGRSSSGAESAAFFLRASDLYEHKLQRRDRAVLCCHRASLADPRERQAFRRIRALFLSQRRYLPAFDVLERERVALGGNGLAGEYINFAELLMDDPFEHELAMRALKRAMELEPRSARADRAQRVIQNFEHTWRDRVRSLRSAALEEKDPKKAAILSLSVAKLFVWHNSQAKAKIREAMDRCFELWPGMPEALSLLEFLAQKNDKLSGAISTIEKMADEAKEPGTQADLWLRAAILKLTRLGDRPGALVALQKAAEIDPQRGEPVGLAAELMIEENRWRDALALLETHLSATQDIPARISLRLQLADMYVSQLQDLPAAVAHLQTVLQADPVNGSAAVALARIFSTQGDVRGLESILDLALSVPSQGREALIERMASACQASADDAHVYSVLSRLVFHRPPDEPSLRRLAEVARRIAKETDLEQLLRRLGGSVPNGAPAEIWRARARLLQGPLARPEEAALAWGEVLKRAPEDAEAREVLQPQVSHDPGPEAVASPTPEAPQDAKAGGAPPPAATSPVDDSAELPQNDGARNASEKGEPSPVSEEGRSKETAPLTEIREHEPQPDESTSLEAALSALSADPAAPALRVHALRLARELSRQAELAQFFTHLSTRLPDSQLALGFLRDAANIAQEAGAVDETVLALQGALEHTPDDPEILSRLVDVLSKAKRFADSDYVLRRRILVADEPEKANLYLTLADINVELSRPRQAAQAVQEAIKCGADEGQSLPKLSQLLEETGQIDALFGALGRQIELAEALGDVDRASELAQKRSKIVQASRAEAIKRCGDILHHRPYDSVALNELEGLLTDPTVREEAARTLLTAYEATKDHRKLVAVLDVIADATKDELEQVLALKRAAYLHLHHLRQPEIAFALLIRALRLSPGDAALRNVTRQAAEDADTVETLAEVIEELLEEEGGRAKLPLHRELADLYEKKLNNSGAAIEQLNKALALEPKNLDSLRSLQRLYRASERWGALAEVLEKLAELVTEPAERLAMWREVAVIHDQHLHDTEKAADCWRKIAERDPLDREAASALDRLYSELDQVQGLAFALALRATQEGQSPQGREIAFRLAQIRQHRLKDGSAALQLYRQILAEDPSHPKTRAALEEWAQLTTPESAAALEILDPILAQSADHARRVAVREARMKTALPQEKLRLAAEIRAIYEQDMARPDLAFAAAAEAFVVAVEREQLRPDLERLARETNNFQKLAQVYEKAAGALIPGDEAIPVLLRRAAELHEHLGQTEDAIGIWRALLVQAPQDRQALDSLGKLYQQSKNAKNLSEIFARKAQLTQDAAERGLLLLRAGEAYEAAGEDSAAIDSFRASLTLQKSLEALEALDRLLGKTRRFAEQAEVLDQLGETVPDPRLKKSYMVQRAQLLEKEGQPAQAVAAYEQALQSFAGEPALIAGLEHLLAIEPVKQEVARVLEPIYRSANDTRKLVEVLEIRLPAAAREKRFELLQEVATLRELLGQKSLAFAACARAFTENPESPQAREELERLAADTGCFEDLSRAYEEQLKLGISGAVALDLWRRLAVVYGERLNRPEMAAQAWEEVAKTDPTNGMALEALAAIYRKTRSLKELALVMKRQIAAESSVPKQLHLLFELGTLAEDELADKELAIQCYQQILERDPNDATAIKLLDAALAQREHYPELATLIGREIELSEAAGAHEEVCDLMVRLGRLKLVRLNDPRAALQLFQDVLARRANHAAALGALEEMARSDSPLRGEAAAVLEPVFAASGENLKLVQVLESRASAVPSAQERAKLLRKVAEIYAGPLKNAELAFVSAMRALREMPDDEAALKLCLELAEPAEAVDELSTTLTDIAEKAADDTARATMYSALARVHASQESHEQAAGFWRRVLELQPANQEAMASLAELFAKMGKTQELLDVLRRQIAATEDADRRASLLFQIGSLQQDRMRDEAGALASFRRLLELRPDDAPALERMEQLCRKQERWPELADVLTKRLELLGDKPDLDLAYRLAEIREQRLKDKFGALDHYAQILQHRPDHPEALSAVERMVAAEPQNQAAVEILLKAYRAQKEIPKLAQLIESQVGLRSDPRERKAMFMELAGLRQAQQEPELAYLAFWRAFKEDPNDADVRRLLEKAAQVAKTFDELATTYEEELPRIAEAEDAAEICLTLGELLDEKLQEPDRSAAFYEKARELKPEAQIRALPALDRLYTQLDKPAELAEVLTARAELEGDSQEKVGLLFRLGQLAQYKLDNPDRAKEAYEAILELDKNHLASARLLEQLYEAVGDQEKLYAILRHQRERVTGREKERILARMAQVAATGLADVGQSIELYRELLAKNPRNEQAFTALEGLLERAQKYEELKELLAKQLTQTLDPREVVRLNARLGQILFEKLQRPEEAVEPFKATLERDPRHKAALDALRQIYENLSRREELILILRRLIPLQDSPEGVKDLRIRLAELLAEAGRREEALDASRRALEVEPHLGPELSRLHGVFLSLKAYGDAVRVLELRSEMELKLEDRDRAIASMFEVADLWKGLAGKPESAGTALEKVLELDPSNRSAFERVKQLYAELKDWRSYAQVVERYLPHLVTEAEKINALRDLAKIQEEKLGQGDVAFLALCRALQLSPADDELREEVERLASDTGSYEELGAVYEQVAEDLPHGPLAERLYHTLAKVYDQKLDEPESAEKALRRILEFDPTNAVALEALAEIFSRRGRHREYVVALEQKLEATGSLEARKQILREIARVYEAHLENPQEAAGALLRALDLEPDEETLDTLVALYKRQKAWTEVAATLLRARDLASTNEKQAQIQVEVAQVYERELGDEETAIIAYRQALELDPAQREAVDSLERLYTKTDQPSELLDIYQRQLDLSSDYREQVKVLFKSANIWESKFQNFVNADACVERALSIDPQNVQAIKALETLRRTQGRWEDLLSVIERHVRLTTAPEEQAELCVQMGDILHQQLKQVDRAVNAYHRALELDPDSRHAMHALGLLYERSGNWAFALEMLQREAQSLGADPASIELHHRVGRIYEEMLLDPESAKAAYQEALRLSPGYLPALRAMKGLYERENDWGNYERALIQEAEVTEEPEAKSKALVDTGRFYAEKREDRDSAAHWYEQALKLVPDTLEAAKPLVDVYIGREDWGRAERMLDIVAGRMSEKLAGESDGALSKELCRQLYRLGYVTEKLGNKDKALAAYEKAYHLDATYLPALEGLGNSLVHAGRYDEALKVFQTILIHHRDDLTDLEVVEIYWQLGDVHRGLEQLDRAQNHFEKALALDPSHEPSLRALVALADSDQRFDKAAEYRNKLIQALDGDAKFEVCVELGALAREKLSDAHMAIDAYLTAHKLRPDSLTVMDALYVLYRETKQGQKAAEMLEKMLAHPELSRDPERAKRVYYALGEIMRDEIKDMDRAIGAFNAALDLDPRFIESFSAIESLLGMHKQWKPLEENYIHMIKRLGKSAETHTARMALWRGLGDLYLRVLQQKDGALMAYQVVATGMPEDALVQEIYAELAAQTPGNEQHALAAYRRALVNTNNPGKICSAFAELAARKKDYDSAYMAAQVVKDLIGDPGENEKEILSKLAPYAKKREVAQRVLTDQLWQMHLAHPKMRPLAEMMALLFNQAGHLYSVPLSQYQVNPKKHRIDVASAQEYQIHHYRYVARLLGMEAVELYSPFLLSTRERHSKRSNDPAPDPLVGIEICHTHPVCLKIGGKFFSEHGQKEVYYWLGRTLALLRPELALSQRLSPEKLDAVFHAAIRIAVPHSRFSSNSQAVEAERDLLERNLTQPARVALDRVTREYLKNAGPRDLLNYLEGAELTAVRTGLFVAGELDAVKRMVVGETGAAYRVLGKSKIRDLMVFAISEDLHALRKAVGVQIEVQPRKG